MKSIDFLIEFLADARAGLRLPAAVGRIVIPLALLVLFAACGHEH